MRDITLEDTFFEDYTTRAFGTGIPTTLAGSPVLSVKEGGNATPITAGVSIEVDAASVTGLNEITVVATAANGYENGKSYSVYISTGTVDSVSAVGEVVAKFTIGQSAAAVDLANGTDGLGALKTGIDGVPTIAEFEARTIVSADYFDPAADAVANVTLTATTTDVTNQVTADATAISGDSVAADNLEAMFDGTGYVDETAPASRAQVDGIGASSGGAFAIEATEDNTSAPIKGVSSVGTPTGTFTNTEAEDGTYHVIAHATNDIDWIYGFDIGGSRTAVSVAFRGFLNSGNDAMLLQAFDFVGTDWETVANIPGQNGSVNITLEPDLLLKHTGTGADLGKVFLRFEADGAMTSPSLNVDLLHVLATNIGTSVGYANGQLWLDTNNGTAGVEAFVNGVADNASLTLADTLTLSSSVGLTDIHLVNGSSITLTANSDNFSYFGDNWTLALGGQSVVGAYFQGAMVSGVGTSATEVHYEGCDIATMSVQIGHYDFCGFSGTVTHTLAGDYNYHNCYSKVPGAAAPTFTKTAGQVVTAQWRNWSGGITLSGLQASDVITVSGQLGTVTLNGADATVEIRGSYRNLVNNLTGAPTVNLEGAFLAADIASTLVDTGEIGTAGVGLTDVSLSATGLDAIVSTATGMVAAAKAIWDRVISKANHDISQSAGKLVRNFTGVVIRNELAQGPGTGNNQIQFDTGASAVDGAYDPSLVAIIAGTGVGQARNVFQYDGATKTATVDRNWKTNPDATSEFNIIADAGREHVNEGLVQAGSTSTTIKLNVLASANNNAYPGQLVFIRSGTGDDQAKLILSYNGTTKVATIDGTWGTTPDTTSCYAILPASPSLLATATQASIDAIELDTGTTLPALIDDLAVKKNATFSNFEFLMVLTSDHVTPATGLTVTGQRSIDGAAFAGVTGVIAEVSNGIYQFDAVAADTNGDVITWRFSSATADDTFVTFKTVA